MHCNVHHTFGRRPLAVKLASREHCEIHKKINEKTSTTETATGRMRYAEGGVIEGWGTADRSKKCQISVRTRHANVRHVAVCGGRCPKFTYAHPTRRLGERQQCLRCFSSHSTRSSPARTNSHGAGTREATASTSISLSNARRNFFLLERFLINVAGENRRASITNKHSRMTCIRALVTGISLQPQILDGVQTRQRCAFDSESNFSSPLHPLPIVGPGPVIGGRSGTLDCPNPS